MKAPLFSHAVAVVGVAADAAAEGEECRAAAAVGAAVSLVGVAAEEVTRDHQAEAVVVIQGRQAEAVVAIRVHRAAVLPVHPAVAVSHGLRGAAVPRGRPVVAAALRVHRLVAVVLRVLPNSRRVADACRPPHHSARRAAVETDLRSAVAVPRNFPQAIVPAVRIALVEPAAPVVSIALAAWIVPVVWIDRVRARAIVLHSFRPIVPVQAPEIAPVPAPVIVPVQEPEAAQAEATSAISSGSLAVLRRVAPSVARWAVESAIARDLVIVRELANGLESATARARANVPRVLRNDPIGTNARRIATSNGTSAWTIGMTPGISAPTIGSRRAMISNRTATNVGTTSIAHAKTARTGATKTATIGKITAKNCGTIAATAPMKSGTTRATSTTTSLTITGGARVAGVSAGSATIQRTRGGGGHLPRLAPRSPSWMGSRPIPSISIMA